MNREERLRHRRELYRLIRERETTEEGKEFAKDKQPKIVCIIILQYKKLKVANKSKLKYAVTARSVSAWRLIESVPD